MERFQPKLILCPTDFSELATFALHYARNIAGCFGARLAVLYADTFMPPPHFTKRQMDELVKTIERPSKPLTNIWSDTCASTLAKPSKQRR